jgi:biotin-dependent carboxylase-like uncharacterized protein
VTIVVTKPGPLAVVVDRGRPGYADIGVPPSGALDPPALALANRLVGNDESAAGLELLLGGLELVAESSCLVAVTGPPVGVTAVRRGRAEAVGSHRPVYLAAGERLAVAAPDSGLRCYLGVRGGIDIPAVLGSRSTDVLSGLGPPPVRAGQRLLVGAKWGEPGDADLVPVSVLPAERTVTVVLGPRDDWIVDPAVALGADAWTVSPTSNRIGVRLQGTALARRPDRQDVELPSEPLVTGAVQVPPSGQPVIFLADHPTTGGYPVVGVVVYADLPALAQARPGSVLRMRAVAE